MAVILVTSRSFGDGDLDVHARAAEAGHTIVRGPAHHPLDDLAGVLPTVDAWIAGTGPITTEHLDLAPRLAVIARYGVGVEAVDVAAAIERGIVVSNTPGANAEAVADHTVGLALAALRSTVDGDRRVRSGDWTVRRGRELGRSTVGIVGFGRIGRGVARRLQGFGSRVAITVRSNRDHDDLRLSGLKKLRRETVMATMMRRLEDCHVRDESMLNPEAQLLHL